LLLRYHYGFDLAAAIVTGLLRIRVDQAVDLLTLALWPLMFLLLWRLGEHFGGSKGGPFCLTDGLLRRRMARPRPIWIRVPALCGQWDRG